MKQSLLIITFITIFKVGFAQQASSIVKVSFKDKKDPFVELRILGPSLYIQGCDGDDLTIEPYDPAEEWRIPKESFIKENVKWIDNIKFHGSSGKLGDEGLKDITALTNRALPVPTEQVPVIEELPQEVLISMSATNYKALLIKIPRNMHLKLSYINRFRDGEISLKNLTGELEIGGSSPLVEVDNISGPLTLSSRSITHSKIKITHVNWDAVNTDKLKSVLYPNNQKFLLYLSSPYDDIDISLPGDLKATTSIHANYGDIYSDFNLVKKYPGSNELNFISADVNGGGPYIVVIANYGNVFLRKEAKP